MSDGCWDSTGGGLWNGGKQKPAQTTKPSPSTPVEKAPLTTRVCIYCQKEIKAVGYDPCLSPNNNMVTTNGDSSYKPHVWAEFSQELNAITGLSIRREDVNDGISKPSPSTPVETPTTRQWLEAWFIRNNPAKWMLGTEYDRVSIMCSCLDDFLAASRSTPTPCEYTWSEGNKAWGCVLPKHHDGPHQQYAISPEALVVRCHGCNGTLIYKRNGNEIEVFHNCGRSTQEVVDSGESVKFNMDGDKWCATRVSFVNLQESLAGFGDTPMQALVELIKAEVAPTPAGERDYEKLSDELCRMLGFECDDSVGCVECPIRRKEVAEWLRTYDLGGK